MIRAAGILILSKQGRALFLKRGPGSDYPGMWSFPGGRLEEGESEIEAAIRETEEETGGFRPREDTLAPWTRQVSPGAPLLEAISAPEDVDYTTFIMKDGVEFVPDELKSGEHVAHAWAPVAQPPEPLHPGARVALARFGMNELGVADAMIAGQLTSPQRYGHIMLFCIRITGTGVAYRHQKREGKKIVQEEEYVYRNPADYLTDEFLQRCAGLPVVMEHPLTQSLDSKEFNKRTIGMAFKAYIQGDEVWAVCKIYDEDAQEIMAEKQLSTSPGVVWRNAEASNTNVQIDGHNFLLEGKPSLMDHIAVCYQGVWDKGGSPRGVQTVEARKDSDMDDKELEKQLAALAAKNAETDTALKTILGGMESITGTLGKVMNRFDAEDKKEEDERKDGARKRADEASYSERKDDDDDDGFKKRHDAEEKAMCDAYEEAGEEKESAKDKAKRKRHDSARRRVDSFGFSKRKDDDDDDSYSKRHDAEEGKLRCDMEEAGWETEAAARDAKSRRKRHDDDDAKGRHDSSALYAENKELKGRLDAMDAIIKSRLPEQAPKDIDPVAFAVQQSRFDEVFPLLGLKTPIPMQHEPLLSYKKRGLVELKKFSKSCKDIEIGVSAVDDANLALVHDIILTEAGVVARSDAAVPDGQLMETVVKTPSGHTAKEFRGKPSAWMSEWMPPGKLAEIKRFNAHGKTH